MQSNTPKENRISPRESQVVRLAAEGFTDKEIAKRLCISRETVATYWKRLRLRYPASNRTELVISLYKTFALDQSYSELFRDPPFEELAVTAADYTPHWLDAIVEEISAGVLCIDHQTKIFASNSQLQRILGDPFSKSKICGRLCTDVFLEQKQMFANPDLEWNRAYEIIVQREIVRGQVVLLSSGLTVKRDYVPIELLGKSIGYYWKFYN